MRPIAPRLGADCEEFSVAEDQHEYMTITAARIEYAEGGMHMCCRWTFTPEERSRIAVGEDVYIQFPGAVYPHSVSLRPEWASK